MGGRGRGVKQGGSSFPCFFRGCLLCGPFSSSNVTWRMGVQEVDLWLAFAALFLRNCFLVLGIFFDERILRPYFSFQGTLKCLKRTK